MIFFLENCSYLPVPHKSGRTSFFLWQNQNKANEHTPIVKSRWFLPNECPGLCQHKPGYSLGKNIKLHEMKNETNFVGFLITKILKCFKGALC